MGTRWLTAGLLAAATFAAAPAVAQANDVWDPVSAPSSAGAAIKPERFRAFTLDQSALRADLGSSGKSRSAAATAIISVPAPDGGYQRFQVKESSVMAPGLAARHPEIKTYEGVGLDDQTATIAADDTPLGFHASVRSATGAWYVDPYYHLDDSVYISYFAKDVAENTHGGTYVEEEPTGDPLDLGISRKPAKSAAGPEIQLRTFRLAMVTDPTYATYFGGPANVTAAKVTLINRVDQIYQDETAIKLQLIADNDKLNLDTAALASQPNGPCGAAACFTAAQLSTCGSSTLTRNRIVVGQLVGASNYDAGHIMLGVNGGGVASLGVIGGNSKAQGCTGLPNPVGDYMAVDYVAHELGHQFAGNHTFNGVRSNCSAGNRNAGTSVEPGSGSSIMAYAGICQSDNLQAHSDPYWSQRSFDEITALVTGTRAPINEVQNISLTGFDGSDSFTIGFGGKSTPAFVNGGNYTAAVIQGALSGNEVQTVGLAGYDADGDAYRLSYNGANSMPIVRGQNNTAAGIQNALVGGNEQQTVTLTGFNAATSSFKLSLGGQTTGGFGVGGLAYNAANLAAGINALPGFAGTATVTGVTATGFTVTFSGASANVDVPALSIVDATATSGVVRETAKGGTGILPAGLTVTVGPVADTGYTVLFGGTSDVAPLTVVDAIGAAGTVNETIKGGTGILPAGGTATVTGFGGGAFDATGFQVTFGGTLAQLDQPSLTLGSLTGATGFVGETAKGGPIGNNGFLVTPTGNHAPEVTVPAGVTTIPPRTPFSLTGSATDADGDAVTYMWEQNDRGGLPNGSTVGTGLVDNNKTNGPLFRQFGKLVDISATDTLKYHSPGENMVNNNPTRVFPDLDQILADNTDAATGACPPGPGITTTATYPADLRECFSEFLPTSAYTGFMGDRTMTFRLTARDGRTGGGGVGSAETKVAVAPLAGPFRVTSLGSREVVYGTTGKTITWDVAGTDVAPVNVANVKLSLSTDGGQTFPTVLAASTPNDGSQAVTFPQVTTDKARIKVEAVGNIFFDVNHADFAITAAPAQPVGGTVPATLSLTLGTPGSFGPFTPGVTRTYTASTTANVISTAGDALLSVADPSSAGTGHLVNGSFVLPQPLQVRARRATSTGTPYSDVRPDGSPLNLFTWTAPVSNDLIQLEYSQLVNANDPLRTGSYNKALTFTLSTTTP